MASIPQPGPETMVTLKVTFESTTRRVKMPLREMTAHVLENNVCLTELSYLFLYINHHSLGGMVTLLISHLLW